MKKILIPILFLLILIVPNNVFAGTSLSCQTPAGIGKCPDAIPDFYYNVTYPDGACQVRVDCGAYEFNCATGTCYGAVPPPPTYACPVGNANWANPDVNLMTNNCCTNGQVPTWDDTNQKWICTTFSETDPQVSSSTSNYVPKWNGSTLVDSVIYDNGNVGIGTTGPNAKLYVAGGAYTAYSGSSNNSSYAIGANSIGADASIYSYGAICTGNAWGDCTNNNGVVLGINNSGATVNIPNSGNSFFNGGKVGIGTTAPNAQLDIGTTSSTWTDSSWGRAIEIPNASVIKWETNCPGCFTFSKKSWGIGQSTDGLYFVRDYYSIGDATWKPSYPLFISNSGDLTIKSSTDSILNLQTTDDGYLYTQYLDSGGTRRAWVGLGSGMSGFHIAPENGTGTIYLDSGVSVSNEINASGYIRSWDALYSAGTIQGGWIYGDQVETPVLTTVRRNCAWEPSDKWISEESGRNTFTCSGEKFIAGVKCQGGNCDDQKYYCCDL